MKTLWNRIKGYFNSMWNDLSKNTCGCGGNCKCKKEPRKLVMNPKTKKYEWTDGVDPFSDKKEPRRLIFNPETEKYEWTDGFAPFSDSDLKKDVPEISNPYKKWEIVMSGNPYSESRFLFNFPGIKPYYIQQYHEMSENMSYFTAILSSLELDGYDICNEIEKLKNIKTEKTSLSKTKKGSTKKKKVAKAKSLEAKLEILDPVGVAIKTIILPDVTVSKVDMFSNFNYKSDDIPMATVVFEHGKRIMM